MEEALAYQSGKKELKFPNEDEIDWVEVVCDYTPSLTSDCDIAVQIGVEELTLKVPPQPKQKHWKLIMDVVTPADIEDVGVDQFLGQCAALMSRMSEQNKKHHCTARVLHPSMVFNGCKLDLHPQYS